MRDSHTASSRRRRVITTVVVACTGLALMSATGASHARAAGTLVAPLAVDHPAGIAFNGASQLFVAAGGAGQLQAVNQSGASQQVAVVVDHLVPGAFDRGPTGVAVDGNGNAYVAETEDGAVYFSNSNGSTTGVYARGLGSPNGLALRADGTLLVADQAGRRILAVAPDRSIAVAASGFAQAPFGVALGPDGNIYTSTERDGKVWKVVGGSPQLFATIPVPGGGIPSAEGIAFDSFGNLWVGSGGNGDLFVVGGTGLHLLPPPSAPNIFLMKSGLSGPINLAFAGDASTNLFIATGKEGPGALSNQVSVLATDSSAQPLAAPLLTPAPLPQAPPHGVAFTQDGVSVDPAGFLDQLPQGLAVDIGHPAAEPMIEVTNAGHAYMDAATFNNSPCQAFPHTSIIESTDAGQTWHDSSPPVPTGTSSPPCTLDPYEHYDSALNRFYDADLVGQCTYVQYTDDDANATKTWTTAPVCGAAALDDHQTISSGPLVAGSILPATSTRALYYCYQGVSHVGCSRNLDGGAIVPPATGWHPTAPPYTNSPADKCGPVIAQQNGDQTGHVVVGPDGTVYLGKANCVFAPPSPGTGSSGPVIAISRDEGLTWTQSIVHSEPAPPDHEAAIGVTPNGTVYYAWVAANLLPYLAISHDHGATWSAPIQVGPPGLTEADQPAMSAGDDGRVVVYFMGTESDCCYGRAVDGTQPTNDASTTQPSMWNAYAVFSTNADGAAPTFTATSMNDPLHPLLRGACGPGRCDVTYDFLATAIDQNGRTWSSIANECTGACATPGLTGADAGTAEGFGAQLLCGPKLVGTGALAPPAWAASQAQCGSRSPAGNVAEAPLGIGLIGSGLAAAATAGLVARRRRTRRPALG